MENKFDKQLTSRNIKPTAMRQLILKAFIESKAAMALSDLEKKFEKADRSTLYRTLKTFKDNKLIHSVDDGTGSVKYALCFETCECKPEDLHMHFFCQKCKQTFCLNEVTIPVIKLPCNFKLDSVNVIANGVCENCL